MVNGKLEIKDAVNEIHDTHINLQQWVKGKVPEESWAILIEKTQANDLTIIDPNGKMLLVDEFNKKFKINHGKYNDVIIKAEIIRSKRINQHNILVIYKEMTDIAGQKRYRMTTAIFRYNKQLRNNCEWSHVHETQIKEGNNGSKLDVNQG